MKMIIKIACLFLTAFSVEIMLDGVDDFLFI